MWIFWHHWHPWGRTTKPWLKSAQELPVWRDVSKTWKITTVDFRVFQVLEFNHFRTNITLFWCFEKKNLTESWKLVLNFSTFSVFGCWSQLMLLFWKLPKPQEYTDTLGLDGCFYAFYFVYNSGSFFCHVSNIQMMSRLYRNQTSKWFLSAIYCST